MKSASALSEQEQIKATPTDHHKIHFGSSDYKKSGLALFLMGFASFSLVYCVQPLFIELSKTFQISAGTSTFALSLTTGFLAFSIVLSGAFSQALGRKGLMFFSMLFAAILNVLCAVISNWHLLLISRAMEGFILGGVPAVAKAWIAEEVHLSSLSKTMGLYVAGTAFGGMMGRVGMGLLTEYFSWRISMSILGLICALCAITFYMLLPASKHFVVKREFNLKSHGKIWWMHLKTPSLTIAYAIGFLIMSIFVTLFNYMTFRLAAAPYFLSQTQISLIFLSYSFGIISSSLAGHLATQFGRMPMMCIGLLVMLMGALCTLSMGLFTIIVGIALVTTGFFIVHAIASSNVSTYVKVHQGHATSLYLLFGYLGASVMGSFGGVFWQHSGWSGVIILSVILTIIAFTLMFWAVKRQISLS